MNMGHNNDRDQGALSDATPLLHPGSIQEEDGEVLVIDKHNGTSFVETLINFLKGNIGAGFLSMPFAFANAGYIGSCVLLAIISCVVVHCILLLIKTKQYMSKISGKDNISYGDVAFEAFGKVGTYFTNFFLLITQFGFCCVYIIFIAQHIYEFSDKFDYRVYALFVIPGAMALALIKTFKTIAPTSAVANVCILYSCVVILVYNFQHIGKDVPAVSSCEISDDKCMVAPKPVLSTGVSTIPIFFGNAIYAFEAIGLVLPMENQMANKKQFSTVVLIGLGFVVCVYATFGLAGYAVFGDASGGSITLNLPNNALMMSVKISLCVALFQSIGVQFFPAIEIVEEASQPWIERRVSSSHARSLYRNLLRVFIMLLIGGLAIAIPKLGLIISLIGSVGSGSLALILPPLLYLKIVKGLSRFEVVANWIIVAFGLIGSVAGTYVSVEELITS